jgi:hypothetical protein
VLRSAGAEHGGQVPRMARCDDRARSAGAVDFTVRPADIRCEGREDRMPMRAMKSRLTVAVVLVLWALTVTLAAVAVGAQEHGACDGSAARF